MFNLGLKRGSEACLFEPPNKRLVVVAETEDEYMHAEAATAASAEEDSKNHWNVNPDWPLNFQIWDLTPIHKLIPKPHIATPELPSPLWHELPAATQACRKKPGFLAVKNSHARDSRLYFLESNPKNLHHYFIDGSCEHMISGTGFIGAFLSEFNAKEQAEKSTQTKTWTMRHQPANDYHGCETADDIVKSWNRRRDLGTDLHGNCESYLNQEPNCNVHQENEVPFQYFRKWLQTCPLLTQYEVYRTEMGVFDEELRLAGTIDLVLRHKETGRVILIDFKRCKALRDFATTRGLGPCCDLMDCNMVKYTLQLSLYAYFVERFYGLAIDKLFILQLYPKLREANMREVMYRRQHIWAMLEYRRAAMRVLREPGYMQTLEAQAQPTKIPVSAPTPAPKAVFPKGFFRAEAKAMAQDIFSLDDDFTSPPVSEIPVVTPVANSTVLNQSGILPLRIPVKPKQAELTPLGEAFMASQGMLAARQLLGER